MTDTNVTMHREKARHVSEAAIKAPAASEAEVLELAAVLWAEFHQCTYADAKSSIEYGEYFASNYLRMARRALEHLPYLKKLRS